MVLTQRCRAIYRLDLPLFHCSSHRLYLPPAPIHLASHSTRTLSTKSSALKSTNPPARNNAVATSNTTKSSTATTSLEVIQNALQTDRLNPPPTTRPPPLTLPTRQPEQAAYQYYYSLGKAFLTFYKTAFKNLYANYQHTRTLNSRLSAQTPEEALHKGNLTRAEWLLMKRTRADLLRIPAFGLVFAICGEFTPFVVLAMSHVVPRSLWIPKQVEKARRQLEERRKEFFRTPDPALGLEAEMKGGKVDKMAKPVVLHIGRSLGLYSTVWDRMGIPPTPVVRRRVKKRMEFVEIDDAAIERDGGAEALNGEEVARAAELRGIDVLGWDAVALKGVLEQWLQARKVLMAKEKGVIWLYLTRPAAWPRKE